MFYFFDLSPLIHFIIYLKVGYFYGLMQFLYIFFTFSQKSSN